MRLLVMKKLVIQSFLADHMRKNLNNIEDVAKNFKTEKFLQLAMDGPSVNWSVLDMLDNKLEENNLSKTINIGSCSQHTVHGALKVGATKTEWGIDKILKALFWILSDSPGGRDDYVREGGSEVFPLRYVISSLYLTFK